MSAKPIEMEQMPKEIKLSNIVRKVTLIISWVCTVICVILFAKETSIWEAIISGIMTGSLLHGLVHLELVFSKLNKFMSRFGLLLLIVFGLIFIVPIYGFVCLAGFLVGGIFMIIDTVLFIMKKPLIYPFEIKGYIGNILYKMTKTMNNGMMTVEDYEARQAELLSLIP